MIRPDVTRNLSPHKKSPKDNQTQKHIALYTEIARQKFTLK